MKGAQDPGVRRAGERPSFPLRRTAPCRHGVPDRCGGHNREWPAGHHLRVGRQAEERRQSDSLGLPTATNSTPDYDPMDLMFASGTANGRWKAEHRLATNVYGCCSRGGLTLWLDQFREAGQT